MSDRREQTISSARRVLAANGGVRGESTESEDHLGLARRARSAWQTASWRCSGAQDLRRAVRRRRGGALFAKEPAGVEVINDADLGSLTRTGCSKAHARRALEAQKAALGRRRRRSSGSSTSSQDDVERLHFLYLTHFSYGKMRGNFNPTGGGRRRGDDHQAHREVRATPEEGEGLRRRLREGRPQITTAGHGLLSRPAVPGYNVDVGERVRRALLQAAQVAQADSSSPTASGASSPSW